MKKILFIATIALGMLSCQTPSPSNTEIVSRPVAQLSFGYEAITIQAIDAQTWLLDDGGACTMYLLTGNKRALLIDTGAGDADLMSCVRSLTDLPLTVFCTHGHLDHIGGNYQFDNILLSEIDLPLHEQFYNDPSRRVAWVKDSLISSELLQYAGPKVTAIHIGDVIDLGDRSLTVYALPGHTPGSYMLTDPSHDNLFSGDALNGWLWMQLEESLPLAEMSEHLNAILNTPEVMQLKWMYGGHEHMACHGTVAYAQVIRQHLDEVFAGEAAYTIEEFGGKQIVIYEFDDWRLFAKYDELERYGGHPVVTE